MALVPSWAAAVQVIPDNSITTITFALTMSTPTVFLNCFAPECYLASSNIHLCDDFAVRITIYALATDLGCLTS